MQDYLSQWEYLQNPRKFEDIDNTNLNIHIDFLTIYRDEQYNIKMEITVSDITPKEEQKLKRLSTLIFKHDYKLNKVYCHYKQTERFYDYYLGKYIFTYNVSEYIHNHSTYNKSRYIDWFLNNIKYSSNKNLFCQYSEYNNNKLIKRYDRTVNKNIGQNARLALDHITISCPGTNFKKFTLQYVNDSFQPKWSNSVAVEYHHKPSEAEQEKIHSILNFILGRKLIKVGTTTLDYNNNIVDEKSISPEEGFDVKYICDLPEKSIILPLIVKPNNPELIIRKLSSIINNYLSLDEDLSSTLNLYNQSLISNPNLEIIVLDASIESFAQSMGFAGTAKIRIYSFIYSRGIGTKDGDIINLGDVEDNLRNIRNNVTHGMIIKDKNHLYLSNLAYRVLYGRILCTFLKVNKYYDLTTGKIRNIDESIDKNEYEKISNIMKKHKYDNSRKFYMDLFHIIKTNQL